MECIEMTQQGDLELQEIVYHNTRILIVEGDGVGDILLLPTILGNEHARILHELFNHRNGIRRGIALNTDPPVQQRVQMVDPINSNLAEFSRDLQNVHTKIVNQQTDANIELLLKTPVPNNQQTVEEVTAALMKRRKKPTKYMEDMVNWYNKHSLYKELLDGLWARIKSSSNKKELEKRLTEELREMAGKCTQGHISRLCNVLVGFDEDFKPEISVGEHLQNKMSAIAQKDITLEEKVLEALILMEELGIPKEEQDAWIDAL
jgi:hypothetical protein